MRNDAVSLITVMLSLITIINLYRAPLFSYFILGKRKGFTIGEWVVDIMFNYAFFPVAVTLAIDSGTGSMVFAGMAIAVSLISIVFILYATLSEKGKPVIQEKIASIVARTILALPQIYIIYLAIIAI